MMRLCAIELPPDPFAHHLPWLAFSRIGEERPIPAIKLSLNFGSQPGLIQGDRLKQLVNQGQSIRHRQPSGFVEKFHLGHEQIIPPVSGRGEAFRYSAEYCVRSYLVAGLAARNPQ